MLRSSPGKLWLALAVFIVISSYSIAFVVAIRTGLFTFDGRPLGPDETKSLWVFAAATVTSAATLLGVMITREQANKSERRLYLDSAVSSLKLLAGDGEHRYPSRATLNGTLAALVHLNQPEIAMRCMEPSWEAEALSAETATWIISEALESGDADTQLEAARLLLSKADRLCSEKPGQVAWPTIVARNWPKRVPNPARADLLVSILELILSKPLSWWTPIYTLDPAVISLYLAAKHDRDYAIRNDAKRILRLLLRLYPDDCVWVARNYDIDGKLMSKLVNTFKDQPNYFEIERLMPKLEEWLTSGDSHSTDPPAASNPRGPRLRLKSEVE
jgi:hypothetical protein